MNTYLFYDDDYEFLGIERLRAAARNGVESSSLMRRAARGEKDAAVALHVGFWPFVREFEVAIDKRRYPPAPLRRKFRRERVHRVFADLAAAVKTMEMKEGSHAAHWRKDAECIGLATLDGPIVPGIRTLIDASYSKDLPCFFSMLAGTEFVAKEISAFLTKRPVYTNLFSRKRWAWGDVHLIPHDDGPSRLEIDLDLARAYSADDATARSRIPAMIAETIGLFDKAAREVETAYESTHLG